MKQSKTM